MTMTRAIFKELVDSLNSHIEDSLVKGRAGIDQARIFIISCRRENVGQARDYFHSMEANLMLCFGRMKSALIPLNAEERLRYLYAFYNLGSEAEYHFDFKRALKRNRDWKSYISPMSIRQCQDEYGKFDGMSLQIDALNPKVWISCGILDVREWRKVVSIQKFCSI
ncbi:MAG: hypothetical protein LUF35_09600 [Lachnospiraceae bacterium]|nr:hypothetical protein [Lachnospiraceae bacterium]